MKKYKFIKAPTIEIGDLTDLKNEKFPQNVTGTVYEVIITLGKWRAATYIAKEVVETNPEYFQEVAS